MDEYTVSYDGPCLDKKIERLKARLATMEAAVRAADRLLDASDTTPIGERRYVGSITEDRETFCTATELLETEDSDDA